MLQLLITCYCCSFSAAVVAFLVLSLREELVVVTAVESESIAFLVVVILPLILLLLPLRLEKHWRLVLYPN